jgi:hypothetical protein
MSGDVKKPKAAQADSSMLEASAWAEASPHDTMNDAEGLDKRGVSHQDGGSTSTTAGASDEEREAVSSKLEASDPSWLVAWRLQHQKHLCADRVEDMALAPLPKPIDFDDGFLQVPPPKQTTEHSAHRAGSASTVFSDGFFLEKPTGQQKAKPTVFSEGFFVEQLAKKAVLVL